MWWDILLSLFRKFAAKFVDERILSHSSETANITLVGLHLELYARAYQRSYVENHNSVPIWLAIRNK